MSAKAVVPVCLHRTNCALLTLTAESHGLCLLACLNKEGVMLAQFYREWIAWNGAVE